MDSEIFIYQQNVIDTYLYFIKENLSLIRNIYNEKGKLFESYNPQEKQKFYSSRAKHLQIMSLIGLTTEHLLKIILLKRGFVLNTRDFEAKFTDDFMKELEKENKQGLTQNKLNYLYKKAENNIQVIFNQNLKSFGTCISLFNKSNPDNYYSSIGTYVLNPFPDVYSGDKYLGYKEIKPSETLKVIQKMRNSYLHLPEAKKEQQGVVWYLFNFVVWLCKKEYPDFFKDETYIGNDENRELFENEGN